MRSRSRQAFRQRLSPLRGPASRPTRRNQAMADETQRGALEVLLGLQSEYAPDLPVELISAVFALETESEYEIDRRPVRARLRAMLEEAAPALEEENS